MVIKRKTFIKSGSGAFMARISLTYGKQESFNTLLNKISNRLMAASRVSADLNRLKGVGLRLKNHVLCPHGQNQGVLGDFDDYKNRHCIQRKNTWY